MGAHRYKVWNSAMATSASVVRVSTGTSIKTMLQLAPPAGRNITIISWGYGVDAPQQGQIELIETDAAATTLTAHVAAGLQPLGVGTPASQLTLGTGATGYAGAPTEGTITASRTIDCRVLPATTDLLDFRYQFMYDERPIISGGKFLRIRATFGTTTNMLCWVVWEE